MDCDSSDVMVIDFETDMGNGDFQNEIPGKEQNSRAANALSCNPGVLIGKLAAWDNAGNPLVDYPNNPSECFLPARTTVPLTQAHLGREVALMLANGDSRQPLIIGLLQPTSTSAMRGSPDSAQDRTKGLHPAIAAEVDGERLVFTAKQEIVLQCGHASLTLTKAGKVLIRGAYLLSRSSGMNRIKGGSVQIN